jgi:triosephosphate isomerase
MKKLIVANWKMNPKTAKEAIKLFSAITKVKNPKAEIVICPPSFFLALISGKGSVTGVQNVFYESQGPFTGEVSPEMAASLKAKYAIIGHSERRALGETDKIIEKKILGARRAGLKTILCVGEDKTVRAKGFSSAKEFVRKQLQNDLIDSANAIIAYEPLWAIGTGESCDPEAAAEMAVFIKSVVNCPVLYGGSVSALNAKSYLEKKEIDGVLVGGASLKPGEFSSIIKSAG